MKTSDLFINELDCIANGDLKNIVINTLNASPKCIQVIPASSSGRYHPSADIIVGEFDDNGELISHGGLVNHTVAVTGIAISLMESNVFRDMINAKNESHLNLCKDIVIASCILHDCMKPDDTPKHKTVFDHPLRASKLFVNCATEYITNNNLTGDDLDYLKNTIPMIVRCIESHMGKWSTAPYAKGIKLPEPMTPIENYVHMCDYLASRKFIDFNFDKYYGR